jgi:hypothetical protein
VMTGGWLVGVVWASEEHAVWVVDEGGRVLEGRRYRYNEPGIGALCSWLVRLRVALVALERPEGLLIERLLDAGLAVNGGASPDQVKANRPRYSVAGGKSDGFDSFVLGELARTDSHRFRVLVPDSDQTKALGAMTRAGDGLVGTRVGLANSAARSAGLLLAWRQQGVLKRCPTPWMPAAWVSSGLPRFSSATAIRAANPLASCLSGCVMGPRAR